MMEQPDLLTTAFRMFFALAVVLGLLALGYYAMRRFAGKERGVGGGRMVQVLSSSYIGVKKHVALVKVPGSVLVLGVTADRINLLSKIEDPDLVDTLCQNDDTAATPSFAQHLQRFSSGFRGSKDRN